MADGVLHDKMPFLDGIFRLGPPTPYFHYELCYAFFLSYYRCYLRYNCLWLLKENRDFKQVCLFDKSFRAQRVRGRYRQSAMTMKGHMPCLRHQILKAFVAHLLSLLFSFSFPVKLRIFMRSVQAATREKFSFHFLLPFLPHLVYTLTY